MIKYLSRMLLTADVAFSNAAYYIDEEVGVWRSWMPERDDVTPAASAKCSTTTLRLPGKEPLHMCIMGHDQFISNQMRRHHRRYECADLVRFWNAGSGQQVRGGIFIFLEVGANIGACSLEVALSVANASMLLFEPNPLNFFHLTSSLKWAYEAGRLSAARVVAFPLGAGSPALETTMYEQAGNTGNSIVGAMVGSKSRNFIRIHVRPLDAIFPHGLHVELMKVDVQGYECEVFRGMRELLASQLVRKIHFEVWAEGLAAQNCSTEQLIDTLQADGYELRISGADLTASKASNMPRVISGGAGDTASNPLTPSAKSKHLFEIEARLVKGRSRRGRAGEAPTKVQC